jgi:hypothetical protein
VLPIVDQYQTISFISTRQFYIYELAKRKPTTLRTKRDGKGTYLNYIKGRERLENNFARKKEKKQEK